MALERSKKDTLIEDLVYLRKGAGLSISRMTNTYVLVQVCGGRDQPLDLTRARLISAIQSLPDQTTRDALLAAYGLEASTEGLVSLKARRDAYGAKIGRKNDTLSDREDVAIEELALRLLAGYYAGAPLPASLTLPRGRYLMEFLNVTTVYRDRRFLEHQQERRVVSLVGGASDFQYHSQVRTRLTAVYGCTIDTEYVPGGSKHVLRFPDPLERGGVHEFAFRETLESAECDAEEAAHDLAGQSFETPTLAYRQEVTFLGDRPPIIWAYDKLSRIERPGTPESQEVLRFKNSGSVRAEFTQLYGGLFSGIAWRWNADEGSGPGEVNLRWQNSQRSSPT